MQWRETGRVLIREPYVQERASGNRSNLEDKQDEHKKLFKSEHRGLIDFEHDVR